MTIMTLITLCSDQAEWSQATFGSDEIRGPIGALKHLALEAAEAQAAIGTPGIGEELADCLLLILDASRRAGIGPLELVSQAAKKHEINKLRTWPTPVLDEPIQHVEPVIST